MFWGIINQARPRKIEKCPDSHFSASYVQGSYFASEGRYESIEGYCAKLTKFEFLNIVFSLTL